MYRYIEFLGHVCCNCQRVPFFTCMDVSPVFPGRVGNFFYMFLCQKEKPGWFHFHFRVILQFHVTFSYIFFGPWNVLQNFHVLIVSPKLFVKLYVHSCLEKWTMHEWVKMYFLPTSCNMRNPMSHYDLFFVGDFLRIGIPWDSPLNSPPFGGEYLFF